MSSAGTARKYAGIAGAAVGVIAAGAAAGVLAERRLIRRGRAPTGEAFGSLRGSQHTVAADDDLALHAEVEEPKGRGAHSKSPTLVFVHGYALNLDCWHFQRAALRDDHRMIFYDQRSHGRSARSRREHCTIDQLGRDLASVLDALAVDERVVLVGHSLGGMSVMALAEQSPERFGSRIVGAMLISTSAGALKASTLGLPGLPGRVVHWISPALVATLARTPRLVEGSRRFGSDIGFAVTRKLAFGSHAPPAYVDFTDEMLAATPFDVVADFFPGVDTHDKFAALPALAVTSTVVVCGGRDAITPVSHSRRLAELVPGCRLLELPQAGHMIMLECHEAVTGAIRQLISRGGQA